MRAAIYSRYSSEGQREASIQDQNRNCEKRAAQEGWQIVEWYEDKAISGSQDEQGRPGYAAMLKAARAKQFEVVLVDDLSRLSRDSMKTEEVRRLFVFLGVRLIGVSDGIDSDHKGNKMLAGFKGLMNDAFLDDLAEKTHRGLAGQALKGYSCGGRAYGYKHIPIESPTEKDEYGRPKIVAVRREIDPGQARWVRYIFQQYSKGVSPRQIAEELNRLKVPSPGAAFRRQTPSPLSRTWSVSSLYSADQRACGILSNPIYTGTVIWNRRRWVTNPETKKKLPKLRPESEWIQTDQPHLRIIPQRLWDEVQARRKQAAHGPLTPKHGRGPKYLLSGLLKCATCGSNFTVSDYYRYGCSAHRDHGPTVCRNGLKVARALAEQKILAGLQRDLYTPEALALFQKETTRLVAAYYREHQPDRERTQRQLMKVEGELTNLVRAIKAGVVTPTTTSELQKTEAERDRLHQTMTARTAKADKVVRLLPQAKERYRELVAGIGPLSASNLAQAREQVRELVGEIRLIPTKAGYLSAELTGRYPGLFKLTVGGALNKTGIPDSIHGVS